MVCSFAANAQTPFHERFYNHLNKPPKAIRAIVKEDPELATFRKYKDARDSLRFLSISITREFEVTYFVFDGKCHYIAVVDKRQTPEQLLSDFDKRYIRVNSEDFAYLYEEYSVEGQEVVAVYSDSRVNVGYMVMNFEGRNDGTVFFMYSLFDDKSFGEF